MLLSLLWYIISLLLALAFWIVLVKGGSSEKRCCFAFVLAFIPYVNTALAACTWLIVGVLLITYKVEALYHKLHIAVGGKE